MLTRYALSRNPPKVCDHAALEAEMLFYIKNLLGLKNYLNFFTFIFDCKINNRTVSATMFRSYVSACDFGSIALRNELICANKKLLGKFLTSDQTLISTCQDELGQFTLAKDIWFNAIGFSVEDYLDNVMSIDIMSAGSLRVGLFTDFFNTLQVEDVNDLYTFKNDIKEKRLFELPTGHDFRGHCYHPLIVLFKVFEVLGFGNLDISNLYDMSREVTDIYSPHLFAYAYLLVTDFFASDGTTFYTGAKCKCLFCAYFVLIIDIHLLMSA